MIKKIFALSLLTGGLLSPLANASEIKSPTAWQIDPLMKFSYGYLPTEKDKSYTSCQNAFDYTPAYQPDINNINLAAFAKLGFQVPAPKDANDYRFYLKLYKYPAKLNPEVSAAAVLKQFYLEKLPEEKYLRSFLANPENSYVKYSYIGLASQKFTQQNPMPQFCLPTNIKNAQQVFDGHLPFDTIYVASTANDSGLTIESQVAQSRNGLFALHNQLIAYYSDHLKQLNSSDIDSFYFKLPDSTPNQLKVISIPKNPLVFNNWKDLPFPQDPKHIFATALVLVKQINYKVNPAAETADKSIVPATAAQTTILELGSVVKLTPEQK